MKGKSDPKPKWLQGKEPSRLLALTDGLFATVLTLLVLDLRIPLDLTSGGLTTTAFIEWLGPHLLSYGLKFLVTGTFWLAHHRNFDRVVHYDRGLLGYNLLFLLSIGLFPFSTATISLGGFKTSDFPFYWALYASNVVLAGVMLDLTWAYAVAHGLVSAETTREQSRYIGIGQAVTPALFLLSIASGYLHPPGFLGPYTLFLIPPALWAVDRYLAEPEPDGSLGQPTRSELLWRAGTALPWLLILGLAIWATNR